MAGSKIPVRGPMSPLWTAEKAQEQQRNKKQSG
jgi:hypothetical protein